MSSNNPSSDQATPSTVLSDRKIHKVSVEDVSDRLNAMKVDTKKDIAVDDLATALAPNGSHIALVVRERRAALMCKVPRDYR